ncbi:unnamed protein product [Cyprideis torosa]|uniref:DNA-binding transcriptional regulator NtrC n=1 Tax=Cyprideis torosa TaxID=163714 RepID=A0A7R8WU02_9CRUS|nr:unnamed protein product [Cyprideis torosa]CAG0906162.1 unnamed protein product [Cyprideis torosa]
MNGIDVFEAIHKFYPKLPVIIITAFGTTETAIGAIQKGAYDYIYKPFDVPEILQLIEKAIIAGRCMSAPVDFNPSAGNLTGREALVGGSKEMLEVYKAIGRVAPTDATVLIRGESGTGKELASRAIYNHSLRLTKPFMVINCVAIPETLLESELFGYEKGTFTGAAHRRVGKIEQARGGTVFLDEIGDMPLSIQAKFLRLLQENTIERLGGKEAIDVDVRIIAATNRDLESAVATGTFREDLYYRLRVVSITMPALRQRKEDIPTLCRYFLTMLSQEMAIDNPGVTEEALRKLQEHDWPGNIRELSNILKKALIFNRGAPILAEELTFNVPLHALSGNDRTTGEENIRKWLRSMIVKGGSEKPFDSCMDHISAMLIREALELSNDNRSQAARILGISRPTLHAKMEKFHITSGFNYQD